MKLKKTMIIAGTLSTLCIAIVAICMTVGAKEQKSPFIPEPAAMSASIVKDWTETLSADTPKRIDADTKGSSQEVAESEYPQVTNKSEQETVVSFTEPAPKKTTPPPAPEGQTIMEDPGPAHPVNPTPEAAPEPTPETSSQPSEMQANNRAASGSSGHEGQIYDPAFGWITPSTVEEIPIDSDGDINKMVGEMGE